MAADHAEGEAPLFVPHAVPQSLRFSTSATTGVRPASATLRSGTRSGTRLFSASTQGTNMALAYWNFLVQRIGQLGTGEMLIPQGLVHSMDGFINTDVVFNKAVYDVADTLPSSKAGEQPGSLSQSYAAYVERIDAQGNPSTAARMNYTTAKTAFTGIANRYVAEVKKASDDYKSLVSLGMIDPKVVSFPEWATQNAPEVKQAEDERRQASLKLDEAGAVYFGPNWNTIKRLRDASYAAINGTAQTSYNMVTPDGFLPKYDFGWTQQDFKDKTNDFNAQALKNTFPVKTTLTASDFSSSDWQALGYDSSHGSGGLSVLWDVFSIGGSGGGSSTTSWSSIDDQIDWSSFRLEVNFVNVNKISVTPSTSWFYPTVQHDFPKLFGSDPAPRLSPRAVQAVVGWGPKFTFYFSESNFKSMQSTYEKTVQGQGSGGISVFGLFTIGGGGGSLSKYAQYQKCVSWNGSSNSLVLDLSQTGSPYLLATICTQPYPDTVRLLNERGLTRFLPHASAVAADHLASMEHGVEILGGAEHEHKAPSSTSGGGRKSGKTK